MIDKEVVRLTDIAYRELERQVVNTLVSADTTVLQAGFKLGVQTVLEKLRNGFVVPE